MYDLWKANRELCESPACLRCQLSYRRPPQLWRFSNLLEQELPRVDLFFSPSRSTIAQHQRRGFSYPMRHLPLFLPTEESASAPLTDSASPGSRPYFLFVGRLVKLKGVQVLLEAFRRYTHADLLIAGDGIYEPELRRLAEGLPHVRFLGRVTPDDLRGLYRDAIALLVPSIVYETFGFITLEALGQGTPVIAHDMGAVSELVHDTGGGLTYRTEDELLAAMESLQTDLVRRTALAATGFASYRARYTEEAHLNSYLGAIDEADAARAAAASS